MIVTVMSERVQFDIKHFKSSDQVYKRSWYGLCHCLFKVSKDFIDRLCHQSPTAPTQPKRNSKALQCLGAYQCLVTIKEFDASKKSNDMLLKSYEPFYLLTYTSQTNVKQIIVAFLHTNG